MRKNKQIVDELSASLKVTPDNLVKEVKSLVAKKKELGQTISALRKKLFEEVEADQVFKKKAVTVAGVRLAVFELKDVDPRDLRGALDVLKKKVKEKAVIVGFISEDDKVSMNITCTPDLVKKGFSCKQAAGRIAESFGGSGGGRDDFAFAGCKGAKGISEERIKKSVAEAAKELLGR